MANKTTNFNLDLPTGDELFNPLWPNSNTQKIDTQMKSNQDNSITNADCVFNTNKFIITRNASGGKYFKFIAPADYVAGYTFQVDGTAYDGIVAGTGDSLADGCFMLNHEVIAYIDETSASLAFLVGSSLPEDIDATTLGGHDVDYFGTAAGVTDAKDTATAAGAVANQALEAAQNAGLQVVQLFKQSGTTRVSSVDISSVADKAVMFILRLVTGTPVTAIIDIVIPNIQKNSASSDIDTVTIMPYRTSTNIGGYRLDLLYYTINSTTFSLSGHCAPNGASLIDREIISEFYAIY